MVRAPRCCAAPSSCARFLWWNETRRLQSIVVNLQNEANFYQLLQRLAETYSTKPHADYQIERSPPPPCPARSRPAPAARSGSARNVRAAAWGGVRAGARRHGARPIALAAASGIPVASPTAVPPARSSARKRAAAP